MWAFGIGCTVFYVSVSIILFTMSKIRSKFQQHHTLPRHTIIDMGLGIVPALIAYFFVCVWVTFSCILNDPSQNILANFLVNTLPKFVVRLLSKTLGPNVVKKFKVVTDRALLLIYMIVVLGSWSIMFTYGYTFIERSSHVSNWHKWSGYLVFIACMTSWFKAHGTSPGYITERNIVRFDNYPYDGLLFVNKVCPTMGIRKLARSKYDRYTNRHVARFDHFCGWIDNTGTFSFRV
jgi:hypothetical protein